MAIVVKKGRVMRKKQFKTVLQAPAAFILSIGVQSG